MTIPGLTKKQIRTILEAKTADKNGFARGFLGRELYMELGLNKVDLNRVMK